MVEDGRVGGRRAPMCISMDAQIQRGRTRRRRKFKTARHGLLLSAPCPGKSKMKESAIKPQLAKFKSGLKALLSGFFLSAGKGGVK